MFNNCPSFINASQKIETRLSQEIIAY